jgi:DNA-binding transcriptional regulator YbjK
MEPIDFNNVKASKKVKKLIAELQYRLLQTEDALEDIARAAEIAEVTGQVEMMSTFVAQANELLRDRIVRPDSSIAADNYKMTIVTDDAPVENNKNVT